MLITNLLFPFFYDDFRNEFENVDSLPAMCLQPKHAHIPEIPVDSNLLFETMVFVFCTIALGMQYINLYKTVWWLPHSNANYALVSWKFWLYNVIVWLPLKSTRHVFHFLVCMVFLSYCLQNFYLIDPYLTLLLVIIMSRRVVYCFVTEVSSPSMFSSWRFSTLWYSTLHYFRFFSVTQV